MKNKNTMSRCDVFVYRTVACREITNNLPFTTLAKSLLIAAMGGLTDDDDDDDNVDDAVRNSIVACIGPRALVCTNTHTYTHSYTEHNQQSAPTLKF